MTPKDLAAAIYELTEPDDCRPADEAMMWHIDELSKTDDWALASRYVIGYLEALRSNETMYQCITCTDWFRRDDIVRDNDTFCRNCYEAGLGCESVQRPVEFFPTPDNYKGR